MRMHPEKAVPLLHSFLSFVVRFFLYPIIMSFPKYPREMLQAVLVGPNQQGLRPTQRAFQGKGRPNWALCNCNAMQLRELHEVRCLSYLQHCSLPKTTSDAHTGGLWAQGLPQFSRLRCRHYRSHPSCPFSRCLLCTPPSAAAAAAAAAVYLHCSLGRWACVAHSS